MTLPDTISPPLARALAAKGYESLTPVQALMLGEETRDADLLVSAQTGSGKTVAFGLALASNLLGGREKLPFAVQPQALVVAPTRELALQVRRELEWLYEPAGASFASCVGGMEMRKEIRALQQGAHIVVGTPGRLRDHITRGSLDLEALKAVVLDEADEMLDLGFREDLEFILDAAPKERRTLMFSATVPNSIAKLAATYQNNAVRVAAGGEKRQHADIEYRLMTTPPHERENALINALLYFDAPSAMVFCATREAVKHLASRLGNRGFGVVALSGELSQAERTNALQAMRDGRARVCVATDVAARGIDLPNLELVIHADLPTNPDTLLHRSGRTGRAGRKGVCVLVTPLHRRRSAERLLTLAKVQAAPMQPPSLADIASKERERLLDGLSLEAAASPEEAGIAAELLARHGADAVALAYVRSVQAARPAGEELGDAVSAYEAAAPAKGADRFTGGVWFKVAQGRKHNVEPRWLLPTLCNLGHLTKKDIGFIRILDAETRFEVRADKADRFFEAASNAKGSDKGLKISRFEGDPMVLPPRDSETPGEKPEWKLKQKAAKVAARSAKPIETPHEKPSWTLKPKADKPHGAPQAEKAFEKPRKPFKKKNKPNG